MQILSVEGNVKDDVYAPGERVPSSGVYVAEHTGEHRDAHQLLVVRSTGDEQFPECGSCGTEVRYRLVFPAVHIKSDPDFR